jgi:hypothetical protein
VSRTPARHQKPPRFSATRHGTRARHQKPSAVAAALAHKPTRIAAAVAGSTLAVSAAVAPAVTHWTEAGPHTAALDQAGGTPGTINGPAAGHADGGRAATANLPVNASGTSRARIPSPHTPATRARPRPRHAARPHRPAPQAPAAPVYLNPLRGISGLLPERIDMGVDFGGSGPVHAIGDGVITNATGNSSGWPGGGWITYRLTDGPGAGLMVYVAEDVTPDVQVGQAVTSSTVIATMFNGSAGIETGWAMPDGASAESQLPEAGGISGGGPFPTEIGLNFEDLLVTLGVPASPNRGDSPNGTLPPNYPTNWAAATRPR